MFKRKSILSLLAIAFLGIAAVISPIPAGADSAGGLLLTVVPSTVTASPGDNVSFSYVITNTYNTAVGSLELTDNEFGPIALPVTSVATGENVNVSLVHTMVAADLPGPLVSSATVTGLAADNTSLSATASALITLNALSSSMTVSMSANPTSAMAGDNVTYNYIITNTGTAGLTGLTLTDSRLGSIILSSAYLAAGATLTASKIYTVLATDSSPITSKATATATSSTGEAVTATSQEVSVTLTQNKPGDDDVTPPADNRTKADILLERGVPGKGILHAPGLQKPFNWNFLGWGRSTENKIQHHDNNNDNDNDSNNISGGKGNGNGNGHGKNRGK